MIHQKAIVLDHEHYDALKLIQKEMKSLSESNVIQILIDFYLDETKSLYELERKIKEVKKSRYDETERKIKELKKSRYDETNNIRETKNI